MPTEEETELANIVLSSATASQCKSVMDSVCRVALTWQDLSLWFRGVKAADAERSIATMHEDNIFKALAIFGAQQILPWYVTFMLSGPDIGEFP